MRDIDYHTAVFGKTHYWHQSGDHSNDHIEEMHDWGFMDACEVPGNVMSLDMGSSYTDHLAEKGLLDVFHDYMRMYQRGRRITRPWELAPCQLPTEEHIDMYIAAKSKEWIENYQGDNPFYLQVGFAGPHDPWDSPAEYRALYDADKMPLSITDKPVTPPSPHAQQLIQGAPAKLGTMGESQNRVMKTYYYGKVSLIDDCLGMIYKALEDKGVLDNTWIIFTTDHGEMLGDHGLLAKKVFYEGALKIPCIFRPPSGTEGWQCNGLTEQVDIAATILDISGAAPFEHSDGRSLLPKIEAGQNAPGAQEHKEAVFCEMCAPPSACSMVLTDNYKMTVDTKTREPQDLYDMKNDPNELHNLVNDPSLQKVRDELLNRHLSQLLRNFDEAKLDKANIEIHFPKSAKAK